MRTHLVRRVPCIYSEDDHRPRPLHNPTKQLNHDIDRNHGHAPLLNSIHLVTLNLQFLLHDLEFTRQPNPLGAHIPLWSGDDNGGLRGEGSRAGAGTN
jgi:hypothetical protein